MTTPQTTVFLGTSIQLVANFTDVDGNPVDPIGGVTGVVLDPAENDTDLVVTREQIGQYSAPFTPELNGLHQWRFAGTSPTPAAVEDSFIAQSAFVNP